MKAAESKEEFTVKNGKSNSNQIPQKKALIAIGVTGAVVIVALAVTVVILLTREPQEPITQLIPGPVAGTYARDLGGRGFVVTEENVEEVRQMLAELELDPADRYFEFGISPDWIFSTSRTPSANAMVRNAAGNSRTIFFDIYIEDIGVVYVSPYMPLGSQHSGFALDYYLEPGTYSAVITHFLVDDDLEIITDVSVGVTITVES